VTGSHARAKAGQILEQFVPVPSIDEQDEILWLLDELFSRLDAAAAVIATVRTKADQFRRSLLHAAFTGALTHTGARWMTRGSASCVPVGWRHRDLSDICRVVSGSTPKTTVDAYWGGDIPWITPNDLSKNRGKFVFGGERRLTQAGFDSCSTQMIPAGSVLFSSRAPIGFVAIAGVSMCTNQGFKSAIPGPDIDKEFLYWQLQERTASIRARASGTTFLEISGKRFSATSLVVPPLTEQREIVQILEEQFSRQEASLALVDAVERKVGALRRSLLHAAFSGELTKDWREQDRG
jgi:restriction endonuclease S subunit